MKCLYCLMATLLFGRTSWADEPKPIVVPPELAAVTGNPEFSGIAWSPTRRRYLVVTDDSGLRVEGTNHKPLLLSLGEDGVLDKAPVPIRGVRAINDAEAICAGPDGTYFMVTSHSPNRQDRTPADRRQLLLLKEGKGGLDVIGRLDLTRLDGRRSLLVIAGLPPGGRLDVEALAYRDEALFIGLKSPLTDRGEAVILRLARPVEALRAGKLSEKALNAFAAASLCVEAKATRVCQGISDMAFLSDGSLVLSANAPKGGPKDHGGALAGWPRGLPSEAPTDPDVRISRIRFVRSRIR
jgi:hypothetical protein